MRAAGQRVLLMMFCKVSRDLKVAVAGTDKQRLKRTELLVGVLLADFRRVKLR